MRKCRVCGVELLVGANTTASYITYHDYMCSPCRSRKVKCKKANTYKEVSSKYRQKLKREVFDNIGRSCACCGISSIEFLTIDHIQGDGALERKVHGTAVYAHIRASGFPKSKYRTLCMNCNFSLSRNGYCPHSSSEEGV